MYDTSARHGPAPSASVIPSTEHQQASTVATPLAAAASNPPDPMLLVVVAVIAAIVVRVFWKAIVGIVVIGGIAILFAVVLIPTWMITSHR